MVGAKPVLVRKQQARLSDFYPVTLPEVQTAAQQMQNIPATTQSALGHFPVFEDILNPFNNQYVTASPLSAEQQLQANLDELRAKTENPEDIVQQYIEDMRGKRYASNVPRKLSERTEKEIMRNINPISYTEALGKFGRLRPPKDNFPSHHSMTPSTLYSGLRNTPQFRDYFGRQTTLPEHFPSYHTEDWLDPETGMVREGAVAPVTAVRRANSRDIMGGMAQTGGGLIPLPNDSNESYESRSSADIPLLMQSQNPPLEDFQSGYFLTTPYVADLDRAVTTHSADALVGVRGFGAPSGDIFQARPGGRTREGATEAIVHSRIPPERLVPFRYLDSFKNLTGDKRGEASFLTRNDLRNFFQPKTAQDFRQAIGQERDDTLSRNQKFDYIRDHLPFMQYAPPEFDEIVDRHGMPAVLTDDEKIRLLEAIDAEEQGYMSTMEAPERRLRRKLELMRRLGADFNEKSPSLRDVLLPQTWGDPMAGLANAPPHTKDALIELFNHRFNTNYPTNKELQAIEERKLPTLPGLKEEDVNEFLGQKEPETLADKQFKELVDLFG